MYQVITSDFVKVSISTSLGSDSAYEKKFSKNITVGDLKVSAVLFEARSAQHFLRQTLRLTP